MDFHLCFKCYRSRDSLHGDHFFENLGPEYEPESRDSSISSSTKASTFRYDYGDGTTHLGSEEDDDSDDTGSHVVDGELSLLDGEGEVVNGENGVVNGGDGFLNGGADAGGEANGGRVESDDRSNG